MSELASWQSTISKYGWVCAPVLFAALDPFCKDNPVEAARQPSSLNSLSVGVPHPQYGVMRLTVHVTGATSLTQLASHVATLASSTPLAVLNLPHLYVGCHRYADCVQGQQRLVLGVLVFRGASGNVQHAPMSLVCWGGTWLPYFEDDNNWVMTGWDLGGNVTEIVKPFGWGCKPFGDMDEEGQGSCTTP